MSGVELLKAELAELLRAGRTAMNARSLQSLFHLPEQKRKQVEE